MQSILSSLLQGRSTATMVDEDSLPHDNFPLAQGRRNSRLIMFLGPFQLVSYNKSWQSGVVHTKPHIHIGKKGYFVSLPWSEQKQDLITLRYQHSS